MKRSGPIRRKTPLRRTGGLARKPIKRKVRRNDKPQVRKEFAESQTQCANYRAAGPHGMWLHSHHILNGRHGRIDDRRNLLRLCERCHRLVEGEKVPNEEEGGHYPKITLAQVLYLKKASDPEWYDEAWLREHRKPWTLPEPEEPSYEPASNATRRPID